jgi:hypothetical protein
MAQRLSTVRDAPRRFSFDLGLKLFGKVVQI